MNDFLVLILSFLYILLVLFISLVMAKKKGGNSEFTRKFVHILVGNWVFFVPLFKELWVLCLVPASFIVINSLSLKYNLIPSMERKDDSLGTVYYAVSMLVLSALGFLLKWYMLPFIGLLVMAYGDGLAAILGKKWGKRRPFAFAPEKSLLGTAVVSVSGLLLSFFVMLFYNPSALQQPLPVLLWIALLTGIFSGFVELLGKKGSDNLLLPVGAGVFATLLYYYGSSALYLYLALCLLILLFAYKAKSITVDGIFAAILTATVLFALGGVWLGVSLLAFFLLGSAISKLKNESKRDAENRQEASGARNWKQVLANSFPASFLLFISLFYKEDHSFKLLSFSVFAAACADTFSSEIGMLFNGRVFNILNGKAMPKGLSGGISLVGLFAGILGSAVMAFLAIPDFGWKGYFITLFLGFLGTIIDSLLGAALQRKYPGKDGALQDRRLYAGQLPGAGCALVSNNTVNLLTLFIIPLIGYAFFLL